MGQRSSLPSKVRPPYSEAHDPSKVTSSPFLPMSSMTLAWSFTTAEVNYGLVAIFKLRKSAITQTIFLGTKPSPISDAKLLFIIKPI